MKKYKMTKTTIFIMSWVFLSMLYCVFKIIELKNNNQCNSYWFNMMQGAILIVALCIPLILFKVYHVVVPLKFEIPYQIALIAALLCGEMYDFFGMFTWWDSMLHFSTGVLLTILWIVVINTICKYHSPKVSLPKFFVVVSGICFTLGMGVVWEIAEFIMDSLIGTNMQHYLYSSGTFNAGEPLIGQAALRDTMKDLILAFSGSTLTCIVALITSKFKHDTIFEDTFVLIDKEIILNEKKINDLDDVLELYEE